MVVARSNAVEWESNGVESQSIHSCNHCIRRILNDVKMDAFLLCLPVQVPAVLLQSDYEPELRHHNNDRHPAQHDDDGDGAPRRTSAADQHSQLHQPTLYRRLRARVRHETNWVGGLWGSEWVRTKDGSKVKGRVRHETNRVGGLWGQNGPGLRTGQRSKVECIMKQTGSVGCGVRMGQD